MNKQILIQFCNKIIQEIEEYSHKQTGQFFICVDSRVYNVCEYIVPLLGKFGQKYIERFGHLNAFTYENDSLYGFEYNEAKINHIKGFIAWLEAVK